MFANTAADTTYLLPLGFSAKKSACYFEITDPYVGHSQAMVRMSVSHIWGTHRERVK